MSAWLDWLRFTAAFAVLVEHTRGTVFVSYGDLPAEQQTLLTAGLFGLARLSHEAVMVFFVLSGFLVGGMATQSALRGTFRLDHYVIDRVARIGLPLIPAVALAAAVSLMIGTPITVAQVMGSTVGLQGIVFELMPSNVPLWTLAYETWFYVGGGALAVVLLQRRAEIGPLIVLGISGAILGLALNAAYTLFWLMGAAAYHYRPARTSAAAISCALLLMATGSALYQLGGRPSIYFSLAARGALETIGPGLVALGAALLLPHLRASRSSMRSIGAHFAGFSYSLYLTHYPVLTLIGLALPSPSALSATSLGIFSLSVVSCMLFSYGFAQAFERPTARVKAWARNRISSARRLA